MSSTNGGVGGAAAFAHGLQPVANSVVAHVIEHAGHQHRTRRTQRMTERDGPAERIELRLVGAGLGEPGQRHRRERLVDLEHADLVDSDARLVQHLLGGGYRAGQHQHRVRAGDRTGAVVRDRPQPHGDRVLGGHHQQRGGAVGDLRRVACVDDTVLLERGLQSGELLDGAPPPHPLVGHHGLAVGEHRHDLRLERTVVLRGGRQLVRPHRVLVEPGPREPPLLRDHLRGDALVEREIAIAVKDFRAVRHAGGPAPTRAAPGSSPRPRLPRRRPADPTSPPARRSPAPAGWTRRPG